MKDIEWLFFDLGGVIMDESRSWDDRIRRTCEKHGIAPEIFRAEMEKAAKSNHHEYRGALEAFGISFGEKWNSEFITPYPEAKEVLSELKKRYKLGIIANQPLDTRKRMAEEWGLSELFDLMMISAEVGFSKPDPRLFKEALYKAQTTADKCVMIGDKLTNDIAPTKGLGFKTVWVRQEWGGLQTVTDDSMEPDFTVDKLTELIELLR